MTSKKKTESELYAVSRMFLDNHFQGFLFLHHGEEEAKQEAIRLAKKENASFMVLRLVFAAIPGERPVKLILPQLIKSLQVHKVSDDDLPLAGGGSGR
jgi:hypothetical protein